ncbi:TPA: glycosyltransferase family 2 protein [bacterium]|nr:glycosyltransferase family 2 protein [bacterium]
MPEVSIVIVSYNTISVLDNCISSLREIEDKSLYEIIVVDNCSIDGSKDYLCKKYPYIRWVQLEYNSGFSRASNKGAINATGKYILMLNADTIFVEPVLKDCAEYMDLNKSVGALGIRLLNLDRSLQLSYYNHPCIKEAIKNNSLYIFITKHFKKASSGFSKIENLIEKHKTKHDAPWLSGAFLFIRNVDNYRVLFDEDFFMYSEDYVLCKTIREKSYRVVYNPENSIIHIGGNVEKTRTEQIIISSWLAIYKINGLFYFIIYVVILLINDAFDETLYIKQRIFKKLNEQDIKSKLMRRKILFLLKKYFWIIIIKFKIRPSSSNKTLKYDHA